MAKGDEWHPRFGIWIFFRILFALLLVGIIFSMLFGGFGMMMPFYMSSGWIWRVIGIVLLLWFVSWIFVWPWRHRYWGEEREIRILRRRYARGEITRAQFKRMMKDLREHQRD
jgi:uncharacterized membrane protein